MVFISCAKCATHSIYRTMENCGGEKFLGNPRRFHNIKIPKFALDYERIGACRNPYSRAVSIWWFFVDHEKNKRHGIEIRQWLGNDQSLEKMCRWLLGRHSHTPGRLWSSMTNRYDGLNISRFLRVEHLGEDFAKLPMAKKHIARNFPHMLRSRPGNWREHMTPKVINLINRWAAPDFENFGYERLEP